MSSLISPKTPHQPRHDYRASSPNYFGLVVDSGSSSVRSTGQQPSRPTKTPSSAGGIHTSAAMTPHAVPFTSNPDYDDFKRQLELNRINLSRQAPFSRSSSSASASSNRPPSRDQDLSSSMAKPRGHKTPPKIGTSESTFGEDLAVPRSPPKRGLSSEDIDSAARARRQSPADFNEHSTARSLGSPPLRSSDKPSRPAISLLDSSASGSGSILNRMSSAPTSLEPQIPLMVLPSRIAELLNNAMHDVLLLDMRVATQYAQARIKRALNLCIPTTLLKRPSYNVHRLADTFKEEEQKQEFGRWKTDKVIIVYDQASSQSTEAHSCVNILKKFASEGWTGQSLIIRGGFNSFSHEFPQMVDDNALGGTRDYTESSLKTASLDLPPVMGGCPLPETQSAANPFFGNIRQNMDLIGGVGQIPVKCPPLLNSQDRDDLPDWLQQASEANNKGKRVADKFLHIEQREKSRMEEALSGEVVYDKSKPRSPSKNKVKVAGIEKGTKNRYHNILPFEHSRVKLKGVPIDGCNYVNANFLETSLSSKKYIATQSPIPATFADFWNMVWQRDVRVVVMLTAETEGNQIKAHNYWNASGYGPIKLKLHSEHRASIEPQRLLRAKMRPHVREQRRFSSMMAPSTLDPAVKGEDLPAASKDEPYVVVRKFSVSHDSFPFERMREVTQLHFSAWPDFGVPTHPSHLLGLIEQCNAVVKASTNGSQASERPVVVHCSAGCGRTGTFCTVDTVVDALKHSRAKPTGDHEDSMDIDSSQHVKPGHGEKTSTEKDLVEQAVNEFRSQRLSMVQSLDQFVMCYETVLEWIAEQKQPPMTA